MGCHFKAAYPGWLVVFWLLCCAGTIPAVWAQGGGSPLPDGMGGVRMGAFRADLPGLRPSHTERLGDEPSEDQVIEYFVRPGPLPDIGGVPLEALEFGFCNDYVCSIRARAAGGGAAYEALVAHYSGIYGTEDRRVHLYGAQWDRYCEQDDGAQGPGIRWVLCEHQTDNCAVFSIRHDRGRGKVILLLGDQYVP